MITQRPVAVRLPRRALPFAAAALLVACLPLAAQEHSRPNDSSDAGWTAPEVGSYSFEPSAPSEPSVPSSPSEPSTPSAPPEPSAPSVPVEPSQPSTPDEVFRPEEPIRIAQERSRPSDSSDTGRTAHGVDSPSPSYSPPPSTSSGESSGGSSSSSSDPGRTARPVGPGDNEPHRQRPHRGGDGHHGSGHHGGHGGIYYPYGNYGYGYWPGFWWWGWWDYPYYPYGYRYGYGEPRYYGRGDAGALDFDVSPGRTEIHLDGQYIGKVDSFDGWPRYLWLPKGTYDVVLYLDGFKTISRQISVYPGSVIDIDDRMEPGDSVRPEDIASKSHERRDERLRYERERRERIERGERGDEEDWRDRVRRERGYRRDDRYDDDVDDDVDEEEIAADSERKGRLRLDVDPEDASVYLDGRFVGTGSELAMMRGGLPVSAGEHRLAVVRPGRKAEERSFEVEAGEEIELEVELESDSR